MQTGVLQPKTSKTCDDCKARKVRCLRADNTDSLACMSCNKRGVRCHFSLNKRKSRRIPTKPPASINGGTFASVPASRTTSSTGISFPQNLPRGADALPAPPEFTRSHDQQWHSRTYSTKLYIDHLLENRKANGRNRSESSLVKAHNHYIGTLGLAFFSEKRIASISDRLGHTQLRDLIEALSTIVDSRMNRTCLRSSSVVKFKGPSTPLQISDESAKSYIRAYFEYVHPVYPFLDRKQFEDTAFNPQLVQFLPDNFPFSALYHSVLALGCQYQDGGAFDPGEGTAWKLYQIALGLFSDILVPKETLVNVQAVTAMAIFAHNSSCVQIGNTLTSEAARMAQLLGFNQATCHGEDETACHRTFWVIYILEKMLSFACGRTSILVDYDIGSPVPETPDAIFGDFDWFFSMVRFSRLISKVHEALFSVSAILNGPELSYAAIDTANDDLECWRKSIPEGFRPGDPFRPASFWDRSSMAVMLKTHYHYYSAIIALSRITLQVNTQKPSHRQSESKKALMDAARAVIELTRYIDTEAYTPIWVLGSMPMSALFILFDFVVHNPTHSETKNNLSVLGIAAGYFCRLEFASRGSLPSSLLSDFAQIARQYVRDVESSLQTGMINVDSEAPTFPDSESNHTVETLGGSSSTEYLYYPIHDILFPMVGGFSEDLDLTNFFDNVVPACLSPLEQASPTTMRES